MSNLITLDNISLAFGLDALLKHAKLQISTGERICLIGRNGAGKSSLLKIIEGSLLPDSGAIHRQTHLRVARLPQELPRNIRGTVFEFVAEGLAETGQLLADYHALTHKLAHTSIQGDLHRLEQVQHLIDAKQGWQFEQTIQRMLSRLELNPNLTVAELSGGWQRRVVLAKTLVSTPDLLLLDEPTNHLDVEAIQWLEDFLLSSHFGLVFITHDRSLLQRLATRIIELDRGQLTSWPGDYINFLRHKEEMLRAEAQQNAEFDKKLAQEEKWIRQGIKARRTRNEGRVRALEALRITRSRRREQQGKVSLNIDESETSGQLVIDAKNISQQYQDQWVIKDFSMRILRGDRIGLLGRNGIGKSTLLNILLKNIEPQCGVVAHGTNLRIAYFDQLRIVLDLEKTVVDNVVQGGDTIEINGNKRHIISYLSDFLFTPQRAMTPVKALSGGESNRLLLAKLFSQPTNLLVLDEPTNDLDIETLELLEEWLINYQGTLLLVSHDRTFLDNVVTSTLVFSGNGHIEEYIGGYQDWVRQKLSQPISQPVMLKTKTKKSVAEKSSQTKKLNYKEQNELRALPEHIEMLEAEQTKLQVLIANPEFYRESTERISYVLAQLKKLAVDLDEAYQRWEELEKRS